MRLRYLSFVVLALLLSSCMWGTPGKTTPAITKDTLTYTPQKIDEKAPDCNTSPDSLCAEITLAYPLFVDAQDLNKAILYKLLTLDSGVTDLKQLTTKFFKSYTQTKAEEPTLSQYSMATDIKVSRQDSSLITLEFGYDSYTGGAHGSSETTFINWNTKANSSITLNNILVKGYKDQLTAIADTIFRRQEKLSDTASLADNYFFKDNKFALNDNFQITPVGLRFLYNEYEIKSYAAGQTELFIPYNKIRSLLLPNTVIAQYIK